MSNSNPYTPPSAVSDDRFGLRQVKIRPIELLKRGYALIEGQYWAFLGIVLVGILVGSAIPFGILLGPMMVGIFLCYIQQERQGQVEFATLFKGFEQFVDALCAILFLLVVGIFVMIPFFGAIIVMILGVSANANAGNPPPPDPTVLLAILVLYFAAIFANMAVTLPFMFTFQLIADRKYKAIAAVKVSARGVLKNLGGIIWFVIVMTFISLIATLMCYVPAFLLMPISFAALFVLYRDIYGDPAVSAGPDQVASGQID